MDAFSNLFRDLNDSLDELKSLFPIRGNYALTVEDLLPSNIIPSLKRVPIDDANSFKIMLNVKHFKPNEIEVKTVDNFVVIHGKHDEKADHHGLITREFTRRYKLPDDVCPEQVSSMLTPNGVLVIKAPRKRPELPKNERIIPITIGKPVSEVQKQQEVYDHKESLQK
ncbi:protein lethal(2)essential for life [Caerostris extrusa]|uniref:Protein lethal(2)essential for life n=1 Tax=Caerostris extrusa TaxID=172846 RepID=A0AAV4XF30_CAEEX|nr:protein lethal(2)essential for life [Caerostris extrusa]